MGSTYIVLRRGVVCLISLLLATLSFRTGQIIYEVIVPAQTCTQEIAISHWTGVAVAIHADTRDLLLTKFKDIVAAAFLA